ncbi:39S ribosomal protein L32, mitochondrial [Gryllus bimaculatus]|nr:39S ribosomal protein L32, mitochondrial [Gryllus bimaculatus]
MAATLVRCLRDTLKIIDWAVISVLGRPFPPSDPCLAVAHYETAPEKTYSLDNVFDSAFLWAVPKHRTTIEKRLKRKFGSPDYGMKIYLPKTNLLECNTCGHHHEAGVLCSHCYEKVIAETKEMQEKIQENLGLSPVEQDVVVLYDNERQKEPEEFWQGKRIVEMKKERPPWFSKNLMQRSTQSPAASNDVKPTELA